MACGCGKSREERMVEREARAERIRLARIEKAEQRQARLLAARMATQKAA